VSISYYNPEFWRALAPGLSIDAAPETVKPVRFGAQTLDTISRSMFVEGYLEVPPVLNGDDLLCLRAAMESLSEHSLPAAFIYLFDQPWSLFRSIEGLISHFLGEDFKGLPNIWAWNIPKTEGASGWPIHRDCDAPTRFENSDFGQTLMALSVWVPLTDATLENGCMHVLPRSRQANYPDIITNAEAIEPLDARALPVNAGSVLAWSQDLYHWSGQVTAAAKDRRMSLSLEFQNIHFKPLAEPLFDIATPPHFEDRLKLILCQFKKYQHMEQVALPTSLRRLIEQAGDC